MPPNSTSKKALVVRCTYCCHTLYKCPLCDYLFGALKQSIRCFYSHTTILDTLCKYSKCRTKCISMDDYITHHWEDKQGPTIKSSIKRTGKQQRTYLEENPSKIPRLTDHNPFSSITVVKNMTEQDDHPLPYPHFGSDFEEHNVGFEEESSEEIEVNVREETREQDAFNFDTMMEELESIDTLEERVNDPSFFEYDRLATIQQRKSSATAIAYSAMAPGNCTKLSDPLKTMNNHKPFKSFARFHFVVNHCLRGGRSHKQLIQLLHDLQNVYNTTQNKSSLDIPNSLYEVISGVSSIPIIKPRIRSDSSTIYSIGDIVANVMNCKDLVSRMIFTKNNNPQIISEV